MTAYLSVSSGLALNNSFYDTFRRLTPLPVDPRVLLVTIDEPSLKKLGPWPWSRSVHADLIDRLNAAQPEGVLLDVIFSEPEEPASDKRLSDALCNAGNVVLPLVREGSSRYSQADAQMLPLLKCAKGLGHINVEADPDGVVRSLYLREGPVGATVPQLAWLAYEMGREPNPMPGTPQASISQRWQREYGVRVPVIASDTRFPSVSYVSGIAW